MCTRARARAGERTLVLDLRRRHLRRRQESCPTLSVTRASPRTGRTSARSHDYSAQRAELHRRPWAMSLQSNRREKGEAEETKTRSCRERRRYIATACRGQASTTSKSASDRGQNVSVYIVSKATSHAHMHARAHAHTNAHARTNARTHAMHARTCTHTMPTHAQTHAHAVK